MAQQTVVSKIETTQTAVEELYKTWLFRNLSMDDFEQAKAMEKEQALQSYIEGAEEAKKIFKEELQEFIVLPKDFTYKK